MKKKGFTLIELIAVIAVLGMVILIATPIINNVIQNSNMNALKISVNTLLKEVSSQLTGIEGASEKTYQINEGVITPDIAYEGEIRGNGFIKIDYEGKTYVQIYDGLYCIYKTKPQRELQAAKMTQEECNQALTVNNTLTLKKGAITTDSITVFTEFESNKVAKEYYFAILTNNNDQPVWVSNSDKSLNHYTFSNLTSRQYTIQAKVITTDDSEYPASLVIPALVDITANITITPSGWSQTKNVNLDFGTLNNRYIYRYRLGDSPFVTISSSTLSIPVTENNINFILEVLGDNQSTIFTRSFYISTIDSTTPSISAKKSSVTVGHKESINLPGNFFNVGEFGESGGTTVCRINNVIYNNTQSLAVGEYQLTCSVQLNNGAAVTSASTTLNVINLSTSYTVSNSKTYQEFTANATGYYQIEAWGAQGGSSKYNTDGSGATIYGGKGAYTKGQIYLTQGEKLYIYVGEKGNNGTYGARAAGGWNGGGLGGSANQGGGGGGGATDIRYFATTPAPADLVWNAANGLNARIMVAAGGGGATGWTNSNSGGDGGTLYGNDGKLNLNAVSHTLAGGGKQNAAGSAASNASAGAFGVGGASHASYGGGGGGGYYGGGGGGYVSNGVSSGAGGSSYISGYAGVNSITSARAHTLQTTHFTGKYFKNNAMTTGVNEGNGKVKISYVSSAEPIKVNQNLQNVRYIMDCGNGRNAYTTDVWVEIQAIFNGTNVAKGKVVNGTSQQVATSYPYSRIVDGDITLSNYSYSLYNGGQCVVIDLGDSYDLDELAVWHYYQDYASPKNNYTYVSSDSINWITTLKDDPNSNPNGNRISAYVATNTVNVPINTTWDIAYTGSYQAVVIPKTGYYEIELWGAKAVSGVTNGAHTKGTIKLNVGEIIYVYAGQSSGSNPNFNAGTGDNGGTSGGGATDIRYFRTMQLATATTANAILNWNNPTGIDARIMVAAGSGSGGGNNLQTEGFGGTLVGGTGGNGLAAGTQTTPGPRQSTGYALSYFGIANGGCAGGNGYYPGGGATCANGAAGGSSFISGYAGVNAIVEGNYALTSARTHSNEVKHFTGKYFINGSMEANVNNTHGRATIKYLGTAKPTSTNTKLNGVRYIKDSLGDRNDLCPNCRNWVEIQAIADGVNVAKGKELETTALTSHFEMHGLGPSAIVDGSLDTATVSNSISGLQEVIIDLGGNYDLDEIVVWHNWSSNFIFSDNITSVSSDGLIWTPIISSEESETANGKRFSRYSN